MMILINFILPQDFCQREWFLWRISKRGSDK
jgi:hypothetical protein